MAASYLPDLPVDDAQLAEDLTLRGIAVEGIFDLGPGNGSLYEMDITTNRVDAMNHYGIAREAAAIYGLALQAARHCTPRSREPGSQAFLREDRSRRRLRPLHRARPARHHHRRLARLVPRRGSLDLLRPARAEANLQRRRCHQLRLARDGPAHACLRSRQDRRRHHRAPRAQRRKAQDPRWRRTHARSRRPRRCRSRQAARSGRRHGRLGHHDHARHEECPRRSRVVRSHGRAPHRAPPRPAHRRQPSLRARRRLQRRSRRVGARQQHPARQRRHASKAISSTCASPRGKPARPIAQPITLALSEVHRILGKTEDKDGISAILVESILTGLGCTLTLQQNSSEERKAWNTRLPSWRLDLEREIDLIEEVARVYGYNRFANTLPAFGDGVQALPWVEAESAVRRTLACCRIPRSHRQHLLFRCRCRAYRACRRARSCRSATRSAKKPACCALRSSPACSRPLPAIFTATSAMCASSNLARSSAEPRKRSTNVPHWPLAPWALCLT